MRRSLLSAVLAVSALASLGCNHVVTRVPGVLDLRSDGSGAAAPTESLKLGQDMARSGVDQIMYGDGVKLTGSANVTVNDRKYFVISLVPILNESATEEIQTAVGTDAIRKAKIGDGIAVLPGVVSYIIRGIPVINILGLVLPPWDVAFSGERVLTGDAAAAPAPASTEPPPPTATPAPAPAPAPTK